MDSTLRLTLKSIQNPVAVLIVSVLLMLMGALSLSNMPAQLLPDIEKPVLTVMTSWPGASPAETEAELTVPIEEVLTGTPGMTEMQAWSMADFAFMQLEFAIETDMSMALIDVISRLNRLRPLPANAEKPQIMMGEWGDANDVLIEYFIQQLPDSQYSKAENGRYLREVVLPELQSLYGVSRIEFDTGTWGSGDQLRIVFDIYKAADLGIDIARIPEKIGRSGNISSGVVDVGRKQFTLRFEGRYDIDELASLIIEWRDGRPIKLSDLATIEVGPGEANGFIYQNGNSSFRLGIQKTNDANVLQALEGVKNKLDELNRETFAERGLFAQYSFDPSRYIHRAMSLLGGNLVLGIILAITVLWLFLRQWRATLLIALAIPISLLTTFIVLKITGRTLNVISLAGLAFASGMVLDAAIVVLENIVRLEESGEDKTNACDKGATQVWGALLASTATTVAIFIPIMFLEDAEGQMFADLAMTIAIGVSISLVVAVTILPTAARYFMTQLPDREHRIEKSVWRNLADKIMRLTDSSTKQIAWIVVLITVPIFITYSFWPTSNYLPPVKRDTIDSFLFFPPGTNIQTADKEIAQVIDKRLQKHLTGEQAPAIRDYFFWSFPGGSGGWLAVNGEEGTDLEQLQMAVQTQVISGIPDLFGFSMRRSLFGGFSDTNSVQMDIMANDLNSVKLAAMSGMQIVMSDIPGATANPQPDPFSESIELRFQANDVALAEVGWTRQDIAAVIMQLGQGAWLGEYFDGQERLDIFLKTQRFETPEMLGNVPVKTPKGGVVPLSQLVKIEKVPTPSAIVRMDRKRGYQLVVNPPPGMSLEDLITQLNEKVAPKLQAMLPADGRIEYKGSAEDLSRAVSTLGINFLIAFFLLLMIMAGLFKSFIAAIQVCIALPLAAFGGVLAINVANEIQFQPLDLLGMIGFIILLGLVVNNAILLVAQTRSALSTGMSREAAVTEALTLRLRPIFMSTLTSLFGMLPLLILPGAGSEIYRGMAAAIVGGMLVSTIFTLILLPCLLQLTFTKRVIHV